jgi:tRNA threonylcarbamoyladenosine biosynthesis protein TsaB
MNYLLHIDTSGDTGIVAIARDGGLICQASNTETRNHAATINIMIDEMVAVAGITLNDLSAVVVCAGPGSYTGLRIGLATAKGLCYALDVPLLLDNKLTLLAYQAFKKNDNKYGYYIPLLLAREREYFISVFDDTFKNTLPAKHIADNELPGILEGKAHICFISKEIDDENHKKYANIAYVDVDTDIDLSLWVFYAFEQFKCNNTVNLSTAEPFYLKQVYTHK